jgi:hypothetical protein
MVAMLLVFCVGAVLGQVGMGYLTGQLGKGGEK